MSSFRLSLACLVVSAVSCGPGRSTQVDRKPIAEFKFMQSATRPQVFLFDAAMSRPTVGTLAKFRWTFGDEAAGAAATEATISTTQHAYKAAGTFTVTLVVLDDKDTASDPVSQQVTVSSVVGPMASVTGPGTGQPGTVLTFDGSASTPSGDLQNYEWDFGDGSTMAGKDRTIVQHAFNAAGTFTVKLTVTDSTPSSATATLPVVISVPGPLAVCSWMPSTVTVGTPVMFTGAQSTAPPGKVLQSYIWDFGDGVMNVPGTMPGGTASHAYAMMGTFTPKLTVTDNSMPRQSHTTTCPDVVVGAAALCNGEYTWMSTGSGGLCQFTASTITVTQLANGTITLTEPGPSGTITYTGTWSGSTFMATGAYQSYQYVLNGTFSGCGSWTGTYVTNYDFGSGPVEFCRTPVSATKI